MDITPAVPDGRSLIDSYGPGRFQVRGMRYQGSLIVLPDRILPWSVAHSGDLSVESLAVFRAQEPAIDVLLLGTGTRMVQIPSALRRAIRESGLSMDIMDTGAACRTFNVLMVEGRRAAAALIAV